MTAQDRLFDVDPVPGEEEEVPPIRRRAISGACCHCGATSRWLWAPVGQVWLCAVCWLGQGSIERLATPEEVDAGCELGISWDPVGGWPQ